LAESAAPATKPKPPATTPFAPNMPTLKSAMCIEPPLPWQSPVLRAKSSATIAGIEAPLASVCPWPRWVEAM
jgi:hypothetical protein